MIKEIRLPEISENVVSGDVIEVLVKVGDYIKQEQSIVELETEKATFEVPSPVGGQVTEINVKEGQKINVGQVILKVETEVQAPKTEKQDIRKPDIEDKVVQKAQIREVVEEPEQVEIIEGKPQPAAVSVSAAPSVRRLARELGIDINKVSGSGPGGRILLDDVKEYAKRVIIVGPTPSVTKQTQPLPDFTKWGDCQRQALTTTRKKIAETLSYTSANVPQATQYDQADITELEQFRAEYAKKVEEAGGRLTITSILLKVVASALKVFPKFNASVDINRGEIIYKKYYHISVAVDTDRGLLVPVIRNVDKKSILQLSVELKELAQKARDRKVTAEDMVGGNFTISNLGGIGGTNFAPIIYWPQVAILGVARAKQKPVYINSQLQPRLLVPLSLCYDHRIIDGTEGLRFLRWIVEALERPFLLAMAEQN